MVLLIGKVVEKNLEKNEMVIRLIGERRLVTIEGTSDDAKVGKFIEVQGELMKKVTSKDGKPALLIFVKANSIKEIDKNEWNAQ